MTKALLAPARDPRTGRFRAGNPGRPKGVRNQLGEAFWRDMVAAWQVHGRAAIEATIRTRPAEFLRVVARLMPRQIDLGFDDAETLSDGEIRLRLLAAMAQARDLGFDLDPPDEADAEAEDAAACGLVEPERRH